MKIAFAIRATTGLAVAVCAAACARPVDAGGRAPEGRRDAIAAIRSWNADLSDADRHDKYCKMAASPLAFFRGTNHLFWADLAGDPRLAEFSSPKTITWIQGDLHAYNFGAYENDRGAVVYSLNDFDETIIADYQYDLWRMATSLVLISRDHGNSSKHAENAIIDAFAESYLDAMADYRGNDDEKRTAFTRANVTRRLATFLDEVAAKKSRERALARWTVVTDGARRFDTALDRLEPVDDTRADELRAAVVDYGATLSGRIAFDPDYFRVKDVARRLRAGIGSLGTPRYYLLIEGATRSVDDDRILDVKRQGAPTPYRFLGDPDRARYDRAFDDHARRHAFGQKALLVNTDDHLGWMRLSDGDYSVRERSVFKEAFPVARLKGRGRFVAMAKQWGVILATAHARADRDFDDTLVPYSLDKQVDELTDHHHHEFRGLLRSVARGYADQVAADYAAFRSELAPICP